MLVNNDEDKRVLVRRRCLREEKISGLTRAGSKARNTIPNGSDILEIPIMEDFDIRDPYRGQLQLRGCHCSCRLTRFKTLLIIIYWKIGKKIQRKSKDPGHERLFISLFD